MKELMSTSWFIPVCLVLGMIIFATIQMKFFPRIGKEYDDGEEHRKKTNNVEGNEKVDQVIKELNQYLKESSNQLEKADYREGSVDRNLGEYNSSVPYVVKYPTLYCDYLGKKVMITFNTVSSLEDIKNENATNRVSDIYDDYLMPYLKIVIFDKPNLLFMLAQNVSGSIDLFSTVSKPLKFNDEELDKLYYIEPRQENLPETFVEEVKEKIRKLPFLHSIHFKDNLELSLPYESIDLNNFSFLLELVKNINDLN